MKLMENSSGDQAKSGYLPLIGAILLSALLVSVTVGIFVEWTINRIYVPVGNSLQLRYKGPLVWTFGAKMAKPGYWSEEGEIGIQREMRGPGRHFYCPLWYERVMVEDVEILPGQVGIVTCRVGSPLPDGQFLVDGKLGETTQKGILRQALGPGRYRVNPYGYTVKIVETITDESSGQHKYSGWIDVPTGYVGVVTNLTDIPHLNRKTGIQSNVLPPGIYLVNNYEQQIDIVEVGFRECTISVDNEKEDDGTQKVDDAGEPYIADTSQGISFPSSDGFTINMDFTAIWGVMPEQAPHTILTFGNVDQVENKVVRPQVESICRNNGSKHNAVQLLVGTDRERFQSAIQEELATVLHDKQLTLLYGLVRHIYIPRQIREPKQAAFVSDELTLTRQQEQESAKMEGNLREAERRVELESQRVKADTERKVAAKTAEGDKTVGEIAAETRRLVAAIAKETATLQAQATLALGEAENKGKQLIEEAKAQRFQLAVDAFGSGDAYNEWIFAQGLPESLDLKLIYAGEGTLWTDMKNLGLQTTLPVTK
ncbi:MAG: SPFH domain-containing protein [Planctomycetota bacterium]|nr:SPFH domain-containing protein [Planctomycetota bacterium]MDA1179955.1 SPFH domain-containing protein [Planctomycetota bacterium]